jgi:predicted transcriptional regulator
MPIQLGTSLLVILADDIVTLDQICTLLNGEVVAGTELNAVDVLKVGASDLMSDVLAFMTPGSLLLTGLTNVQVVRTSDMADLCAICFVRGKHPDPHALALAEENGLPIIKTPFPMYKACGLLWNEGVDPCF